MADFWKLGDAVNLRPETFGGMVFHREQGITLEVDTEAYYFLCSYLTPHSLPLPDHPAAYLVPQLVRLGILHPTETASNQIQSAPTSRWLRNDFILSAPEAVHLAITTRCDLSCPGCYSLHSNTGPELTSAELRSLIDQWAEMRVFQLAVGGGEPLLYEGLFDVLTYARQQGIIPNLTTNGTLLTANAVRQLEDAGVVRVNVSWNGPGHMHRQRSQTVIRALNLLLNSTLQAGINLLVTSALLPRLTELLVQLQGLGIQSVTLLRPKPPANPTKAGKTWYYANRLCRTDLFHLRTTLLDWKGTLKLEVGSALVNLMGDVPPALLRQRAIYGCTAGRRICTVWPNGQVTPCSFLADLSAGNVRQTSFAELWQRGKNWGSLRHPTTQPQNGCTDCTISLQCGGAYCVARYEDTNMSVGDTECLHYQEELSV